MTFQKVALYLTGMAGLVRYWDAQINLVLNQKSAKALFRSDSEAVFTKIFCPFYTALASDALDDMYACVLRLSSRSNERKLVMP